MTVVPLVRCALFSPLFKLAYLVAPKSRAWFGTFRCFVLLDNEPT